MSIIASSKSELRKFFLSKRNKVTKKYSNYVSLEITNYAEEIINTFAVNPSKIVGEIKEEIKESILEGKIKNTRKEAYSLMLKIGKKKGLIAKI